MRLPYSLQGRFLVGLIVLMLFMGTFFALLLRSHMKDLFLSEARAKANLMAAHTEAIQNYVRTTVRPAISAKIGQDEFILEAMSTSFVTRHILSKLSSENNDFTYRRVAKNARNPDYEVNLQEAHFFDQFIKEPESQRIEEITRDGSTESLLIARPVYFTQECMRCHGDPEEAPAVLLSLYGDKRGFWRQSGELAGLDIISVPMESATGSVGKSVSMFALWFGSGMLLLLLSVQGFFNRLVVHNLRRVGNILHRKFFQEDDRDILAPLRNREDIEGMVLSIEVVATHLSAARRQLSDYARNLEGMVKERTAALESVAGGRIADVQLFMRLLSDLNLAQEKHSLLQTSLRLIARHFQANRAAYACGLSGADVLAWPATDGATEPESWADLLAHLRLGQAEILPNVWYIPVQTSGQARGMIALYWDEHPAPTPAEHPDAEPSGQEESTVLLRPGKEQFPFALALGKQLGIALDNLDALDALLRQNSLLDSIVEGVSDPLILVERGAVPVLANSSARALTERLSAFISRADRGLREGAPFRQRGAMEDLAGLLALMGIHQNDAPPDAPVRRETLLPDGSSFAVSMHALQPLRAGDFRAVVHLRETTEEKRMLANLRQSEKLAATGQLAAGLAHEINNPLGVIRCYAELLGNASPDEQSRGDVDVILRHVEQAQTVLRDMLDFARPRAPQPGRCDMQELLVSLLELFKPQARSASVELSLETEPDLPELRLDKGVLEQVIVNLMLNSLDAIQSCPPPEGGTITLRAKRGASGEHLIISIIDNGPGIPEQTLQKIFDPFFTTKAPGAGTGLGLTIAFGMVRDMGGRLEAHSPPGDREQGGGTAFHILLPLHRNTNNPC